MKMLTTAAVVLAIFFTAVSFVKTDVKDAMNHASETHTLTLAHSAAKMNEMGL